MLLKLSEPRNVYVLPADMPLSWFKKIIGLVEGRYYTKADADHAQDIFNEALDFLPSKLGGNPGHKVLMPPGEFNITGEIIVRANRALEGAGAGASIINNKGTTAAIRWGEGPGASAHTTRLADFKINGTAISGYGIYADRLYRQWTVERVHIENNLAAHGVYFDDVWTNGHVRHLRVDCTHDGLRSTGDGLHWVGDYTMNGQVIFENCWFRQMRYGMQVMMGPADSIKTNVLVQRSHFQKNAMAGMRLESDATRMWTILACHFESHNGLEGSGPYGLVIDNDTEGIGIITVQGSIFGPSVEAVRSSGKNDVFIYNTFSVPLNDLGAERGLHFLSGAERNLVLHNHFRGRPSNPLDIGIRYDSGANNNKHIDNIFTDVTANVSDAGSGNSAAW